MKIEDYRVTMEEHIKKSIESFMKKVTEVREEILLAFIAKYGLHPDEIMAMQFTDDKGNTHFWIEKKPEHGLLSGISPCESAHEFHEKLVCEQCGQVEDL